MVNLHPPYTSFTDMQKQDAERVRRSRIIKYNGAPVIMPASEALVQRFMDDGYTVTLGIEGYEVKW
jgi:hypothetical protein